MLSQYFHGLHLPILIFQAAIVFISAISGDAIVAASISGGFILINGVVTVVLTRWLEIKWKQEVREELREEGTTGG